MLGRLTKYEFKATGRTMLPMLGALLLLGVLANFSIRFLDSGKGGILETVATLMIVLYVFGLIAACVMTVVIMVQRFKNNLLGDEGYLMFTLPTNVHSLVWAKLIASVVWYIAVFVCVVLSVLLMVVSVDMLSEVKDVFAEIGRAVSGVGVGRTIAYILETVLLVVTSLLMTCLMFYSSMAVGQCFNKRRTLLAVVFFIVVTYALQILSVALLRMLPDEAYIVYNNGNLSFYGAVHAVLLSMSAYNAVISALFYLLTTLLLKKKLNLE